MTPLAVTITAILAAISTYGGWQFFFKQFSLYQLGYENTIEALRWEPIDTQQRISARGTMSRFEWISLQRRHRVRLASELTLR